MATSDGDICVEYWDVCNGPYSDSENRAASKYAVGIEEREDMHGLFDTITGGAITNSSVTKGKPANSYVLILIDIINLLNLCSCDSWDYCVYQGIVNLFLDLPSRQFALI